MKTLKITRLTRAAIQDHCLAAYPNEACGILAGATSADGVYQVSEALAMANIASFPQRRFEIDPKEQMNIERATAARGRQVVGFYHSHPDSPPIPSEIDKAAAWPFYRYLILRVDHRQAGEMKCWVFDESKQQFDEHKVEVLDI